MFVLVDGALGSTSGVGSGAVRRRSDLVSAFGLCAVVLSLSRSSGGGLGLGSFGPRSRSGFIFLVFSFFARAALWA